MRDVCRVMFGRDDRYEKRKRKKKLRRKPSCRACWIVRLAGSLQEWINFSWQQENTGCTSASACLMVQSALCHCTVSNRTNALPRSQIKASLKPLSILYICLFAYLSFIIHLFQKDRPVPCLNGTFQSRFGTRHKPTNPKTCKEPSIIVATQHICSNKTITQ